MCLLNVRSSCLKDDGGKKGAQRTESDRIEPKIEAPIGKSKENEIWKEGIST
jgi:hypothetical protein